MANTPNSKKKAPETARKYMARKMGLNEGSPGEEAGESPGLEAQEQAFGIDMPTQNQGGLVNGSAGGRGRSSPAGMTAPASDHQGSGKTKQELSPNNTNHAGPMTKGPSPFGMPSRAAIQRRIQANHKPAGQSKAPSAKNARGRKGVLSKFEGFSPNRG